MNQTHHRLILSTVGTSLLTNQIDSNSEGSYQKLLRDHANEKRGESSAEVSAIIDQLKERAITALQSQPTAKLRQLSAELNGIYGIYDGDLSKAKGDIHILITTDTHQGTATAEAIDNYLKSQGANCTIYIPTNLRTSSSDDFSAGVDNLITKLDETIPGYRESGYEVDFNLVGSFKSLQAIMNTLGMFYADRICYLFEGSEELITIPRLPVTIDSTIFAERAGSFYYLAAGGDLPTSELSGVPEALYSTIDDRAMLSNWGKVAWNNAKRECQGEKPYPLPAIDYSERFLKDFARLDGDERRVDAMEQLARVAALFIGSGCNTQKLRQDSGLNYSALLHHPEKPDHFRLNRGDRVTCSQRGERLLIHRCGGHEINDDPI